MEGHIDFAGFGRRRGVVLVVVDKIIVASTPEQQAILTMIDASVLLIPISSFPSHPIVTGTFLLWLQDR